MVSIDELSSKFPVIVISITVLVLILFYWIMKQLTLGIVLRIREVRKDNRELLS